MSKSEIVYPMSNGLSSTTVTVEQPVLQKPKKKERKREELQGLRALAITAVLLFHIWPEVFQNGYLGVDMLVPKMHMASK